MKVSLRFWVLIAASGLFLFSQTSFAEQLWRDDVCAAGNSENFIFPLETISLTEGMVLSISADEADKWQVSSYGVPLYDFSNANGVFGVEYADIPLGALVGRIGESGEWFFIGTDFHQEIIEPGSLYLACWDTPGQYGDNADCITVTINQETFDPADLDKDNDVDGTDLFLYLSDMSELFLSDVAGAFGYINITNDANLVDLSLSAVNLSPQFSIDHTDYLVTVENSTAEISITPILSDPLAGLTINTDDTEDGVPFSVSLDPGSNYIPITVTSQDGSVVKTYSLLVIREGAAALSALSASFGELLPSFSPLTRVYTINTDPAATMVDLTPVTDDPGSLIRVNETDVSSGNSFQLMLDSGITEAKITVSHPDGSTVSCFVYVKKAAVTTLRVYVVDDADAEDEFETLTGAIQYLNTHLMADETGEIRIQRTSPMAVDALNLTGNIIITVASGASNVIEGPSDNPLVITTAGGFDFSGLSFTQSPGYTINAAGGLTAFGSCFSADTTINMAGSATDMDTEPAPKGSGTVSEGFNFVNGSLSGYLNINLTGNADTDYMTAGTSATGINFDASGSFVGNAGLVFKANNVLGLNVTASLTGNTYAEFIGHGSVGLTRLGFTLQENARVHIQQHTTATLKADWKGVNAAIEFDNVTTADAQINSDLTQSQYTGKGNSITNLKYRFLYDFGAVQTGITETGGHLYKTVEINAEDAPVNAQFMIGLDEMDISGNFNLFAGGRATVNFDNGTVFRGEAYLNFPGSWSDLTFDDIKFRAEVSLLFQEINTEVYVNVIHMDCDKGMNMDFMNPAAEISGSVDHITTITGGLRVRFGSESPSESSPYEAILNPEKDGPLDDKQLIFKNLDITDTSGQPGLYIDGVTVPVIIQNSTIDASLWSIVCSGIDADVTIQDNTNLTGGIFLDGDPKETGVMIDRQYTVSNNTITQNTVGGSAVHSHAIRNIALTNNTLTAQGTHGILLSGGKMTVDGGKIIAMGGTAIGLGPSAGGANAVLYADSVNPITGIVMAGSDQGYVKLTNNTFSGAMVIDHEDGRLLSDPMGDNTGLDPDTDIIGSYIDWNDDNHHCPDYPPKCDVWDDDQKECGCGENGIDPPSEPGI